MLMNSEVMVAGLPYGIKIKPFKPFVEVNQSLGLTTYYHKDKRHIAEHQGNSQVHGSDLLVATKCKQQVVGAQVWCTLSDTRPNNAKIVDVIRTGSANCKARPTPHPCVEALFNKNGTFVGARFYVAPNKGVSF